MSSTKTTNKIFIISLIFFIILYTVCRFMITASFAEGVLYGYLLSGLNFLSLSKKVRDLLEGEPTAASSIGLNFRLLVTGGILVLLIKYMSINVFGILVGISILPLSIPAYVIYKNILGKD